MNERETASKSFLNSDVIDDDFFIDIVERRLNIARDKFKLRLVFITPATGNNENFSSVVYRTKINIEIIDTKEKKVVSVIVKALIATVESLKELDIFKREILMYENVIASFQGIFDSKANEVVKFGPECIKIMREPYEVIVLEDLKEEGYLMGDRKVGLNLEESKLLLAKIAKFHAASAVRYQIDEMINERLDRLSMRKNEKHRTTEHVKKSTESFMLINKRFIETIKSMKDIESIAAKAEQWDKMKVMTVFMAVTEPLQSGFKVLNHGDNWVNNLMFKYDENQNVLDVKLIDFQLSFWGSPANDIIYFLVSSVADDIKTEYFDDLIQHYHDELVRSLKKLSYDQPIPTLYEIHIDLLQKGAAFTFNMMLVLMIIKNSSDKLIDIGQIFNRTDQENDPFEEAFSNPIYKKSLASWLKFLDKRGFLDVLLPSAPLTPFMTALLASIPKTDAEMVIEK